MSLRDGKICLKDLSENARVELCRILDSGGAWRALAGAMGYSPKDIIEMERSHSTVFHSCSHSPARYLLDRWGQQLHHTNELFMLLYKIKHVPALRCLAPHVEQKMHRLLQKLEKRNQTSVTDNEESIRVPLPVRLIGQNEPLQQIQIPQVLKIPYHALEKATNYWDPANRLGKGGFGEVFKGVYVNTNVAIKRLSKEKDGNRSLIPSDFSRELWLNAYKHDNIISLFGISTDSGHHLLVYQLMAEGSLDGKIRPRDKNHPFRPLTWKQRLGIATGIARGLQYLHTVSDRPLIHGDIKPANILLDQCLVPKISDFGLARVGLEAEARENPVVSRVIGTRPYLPLDYIEKKQLSPSIDVFSFGMVILEMTTALRATDETRKPHVWLKCHIKDIFDRNSNSPEEVASALEDRLIASTEHSNQDLCLFFIKLGLECVSDRSDQRPDMVTVFKWLESKNDFVTPAPGPAF